MAQGEHEPTVHFLSAEEIVDLFAEFQRAAKEDPAIRLEVGRDYLLPVEELEELCEEAASRDPLDAAATYLRALYLMNLFPDGNFRMGLLATELFLNENGLVLDYTVAEAEALRRWMDDLRDTLYTKRGRGNVTVLTEPYNELHEVPGAFIEEHVTEPSSSPAPMRRFPLRKR